MTEIKLTKRYPQSRTEDITDAYMRGWNDALDAVQNGKFHIADVQQTDKSCDTCGTPRDKCVYCIEEDRMWTPQTDCGWK